MDIWEGRRGREEAPNVQPVSAMVPTLAGLGSVNVSQLLRLSFFYLFAL